MRALVADVLPYLVVRKEQAKVFQQSLDGLMPKAHAALRLKAMKRAVNVTNIEATGVEYNLVLAQASRDAASQG